MRESKELILHWLSALSSGIPCLLLAARMLQLWIAPHTLETSWASFGGGLFLMELVVIHATVATTSVLAKWSWRQLLSLIVLVAAYLGLGWALSYALDSQELFAYIAFLILGRVISGAAASRAETNQALGRLWIQGVFFMVLAVPTFSGSWPRLGLTPELVATTGYVLEIELHGMVGGAAIYFALAGLTDLFGFGWLGGRQLARKLAARNETKDARETEENNALPASAAGR